MSDELAAEDQPVPYTVTPAGLAYLADHPDIAAGSEPTPAERAEARRLSDAEAWGGLRPSETGADWEPNAEAEQEIEL